MIGSDENIVLLMRPWKFYLHVAKIRVLVPVCDVIVDPNPNQLVFFLQTLDQLGVLTKLIVNLVLQLSDVLPARVFGPVLASHCVRPQKAWSHRL